MHCVRPALKCTLSAVLVIASRQFFAIDQQVAFGKVHTIHKVRFYGVR